MGQGTNSITGTERTQPLPQGTKRSLVLASGRSQGMCTLSAIRVSTGGVTDPLQTQQAHGCPGQTCPPADPGHGTSGPALGSVAWREALHRHSCRAPGLQGPPVCLAPQQAAPTTGLSICLTAANSLWLLDKQAVRDAAPGGCRLAGSSYGSSVPPVWLTQEVTQGRNILCLSSRS